MNDLLQELNDKQREAVQNVSGPLLIIAGAGSGKTRVITYRIAYLLSQGIPSWNILAVTFTNKAAEEMRVRVTKLLGSLAGPQRQAAPLVSTYHSFCVRVLRQDVEKLGYLRNFVIYDDDDSLRLIKQCLQELNIDDKKNRPRDILSIIDKAKDDLLDAESYQIYAGASHNDFRLAVGEIYRRYQKKLKENNALDFGDLIMLAVQLWQNHPEILARYQERFQYLMVDEYQDTNHAQYILTRMLAHKHKNICVVGDEDQSIYMFRGADIRNILDFEKDYQQCAVIKLEQNYRSTQHILETAHKVIAHNRFRKPKELWTSNRQGDPVLFHELGNEIEEANYIARQIDNLLGDDVLPRDVAIFYRTNAQSRVLEDALRRAGLHYLIVGGMRFYERKEVKDLLAYLRVIINPADALNLKRIINIPNRGIGKTSLDLIENYALEHKISLSEVLANPNADEYKRDKAIMLDALREDAKRQAIEKAVGTYVESSTLIENYALEHNISLSEVLANPGAIPGLKERAKANISQFTAQLARWREDKDKIAASELTMKIIEETHYLHELADGTMEAEGRIENVKELISAVKEFEEQSEEKTLETYLEQVALVSDIDTWKQEKDYVTLMTLHLAKGLEFGHVFMVGLEEGLLPHINSMEAESELEEERRLCYVGMTRAKQRLFISSAAERRLNGVRRWNIPSRFILEAGLTEQEQGQVTDDRTPAQSTLAGSQLTEKDKESEEFGLRRGQRIVHEVFGEGSIIEVTGAGTDQKVIVDFDHSGRKKLLVKAANLKVL